MMKYVPLLTIAIVASTLVGLHGVKVHGISDAVSSQSALLVNPVITEQIAVPGKKSTAVLHITNVTREPMVVDGTVEEFVPSERLLETDKKSIFDASRWYSLAPAEFELDPGETQTVTVSVNASNMATPGGHYATIYFQPTSTTKQSVSTNANQFARIGVLSFLIVKGEAKESMTVQQANLSWAYGQGTYEQSVVLRNEGNIHLDPRVTMKVYDRDGSVVANASAQTSIALPYTDKTYKLPLNTKGLFGIYHAKVYVDYGTQAKRLESKSQRIVVVSWKIMPVYVLLNVLLSIFTIIILQSSRWTYKIYKDHAVKL